MLLKLLLEDADSLCSSTPLEATSMGSLMLLVYMQAKVCVEGLLPKARWSMTQRLQVHQRQGHTLQGFCLDKSMTDCHMALNAATLQKCQGKSQAFFQHLSAAPPMSTQPLEGMEASVPNWQALTGSAESCKVGIAGDSCKASSVAEAVSAPDSCCLNVVAVNRPSADTGVVTGERVLFSSKASKLAVTTTLQDKCWQCLQRQMLIIVPHGHAANKTYR